MNGPIMEQNKDFEEFIELLNKNKVRFVIVGGHAVAFHGYPRYTGDIDFLFESDSANAKAIVKTLTAFGFKSLGISNQDLCKKGQVVQLGQPPNRIDLINVIDGVAFKKIWTNKVPGKYGSQPCFYIGFEELLANKANVRRPKDIADIEILKKQK